MNWIAIVLLAAGAIGANVQSSGNYNQVDQNSNRGRYNVQNQRQNQYGHNNQNQYQPSFGQYDNSESYNNVEVGQNDHIDEYSRQQLNNQKETQEYYDNENPVGQNNNPGRYQQVVSQYRNQVNDAGYVSQGGNAGEPVSENNVGQSNKHSPGSSGVYNQGINVNYQQQQQRKLLQQKQRYEQVLEYQQLNAVKSDNDFGLSNIDPDILDELQIFAEPLFALYTRDSTPHGKYQLENALEILKNPNFNKNQKTTVYIHGFTEGLYAESVKTVIKTYTTNTDHNLLVLDWHWYSAPPYFLKAVPNVVKVGKRAAKALLNMINNGVSVRNLHIVGHSLGGQMAGIIGRTIQKNSRGAIILPRVTALDPAFPGYYGIPNTLPVNEYDAEYVDVLHTDVGVYGAPVSTGTVDFWPNGGLPPQPGCFDNVCSHARSWWYWTDSVIQNATTYFNAVKSKSWWNFRDGDHDEYDGTTSMGLNCPSGLYGNYYLQTNTANPFAKGPDGISFVQAAINGVLPPTPLLDKIKNIHHIF